MFNLTYSSALDFRLCKENYNEFLDMYPAWVVEAANLITSCKGFDTFSLVAGPQYRIPIHDALHVFTGIDTTPRGEDCIGALEYHLMGWECNYPEELEEALFCWERMPAEQKEFFANFYKEISPFYMEIDMDFFDYQVSWSEFVQETDPELFNKLFPVKAK